MASRRTVIPARSGIAELLMVEEELAFGSVTELAARIDTGELSCAALASMLLDRIARYDEKLHSFIAVYDEETREAAKAADAAIRSGHRVGPFHGIPIAIKDIIELAGRVTTGGSRVNEQRLSRQTATLVQNLISAGMIIIGKTHTVEFAAGGWGTNQYMGTPWNPWDANVHRAPGGSSSGSGVSVAAGLVPWAIGTDTGGSVRIPSAWCGLTGLKTTVGRVSVHGVMPLSDTLDTPGPLCRTVEDAAALFVVLQSADRRDPRTLQRAALDPMPSMREGVNGLRLAHVSHAELEAVDPEVLTAFETSLDLLRGEGAEIAEVELPMTFAEMGRQVGLLFAVEGYAHYGELYENPELPLDDDVRLRIMAGKDVSAVDYLQLLRAREALKCGVEEVLQDYDAFLSPATLTAAPVVGTIDQTQTPAWFTRASNLLERSAIVVPNGFTSAGLPISLQIMCDGYDEAMAVRIAWWYQHLTDWHQRHPMLTP